MTVTEYAVLNQLTVQVLKVLTRSLLLQRVRFRPLGPAGAVRPVIKKLRRKLGDDAGNPVYILN